MQLLYIYHTYVRDIPTILLFELSSGNIVYKNYSGHERWADARKEPYQTLVRQRVGIDNFRVLRRNNGTLQTHSSNTPA